MTLQQKRYSTICRLAVCTVANFVPKVYVSISLTCVKERQQKSSTLLPSCCLTNEQKLSTKVRYRDLSCWGYFWYTPYKRLIWDVSIMYM